jgi:calmodulin
MQHLLTTVGEKLTDYEAEELMRVSGCVQGGMVNYESEYLTVTR